MSELVIGYDCRTNHRAEDWTEERRDSFLIKRDVPNPKSVDGYIWPSVLEEPDFWTFSPHQNFPSQCFEKGKTRIAITVLKLDEDPNYMCSYYDRGFESILVGYINMIAPEPQWKFLGFDIADESYISGLCDCGYSISDKLLLENYWSARLNADGLFFDVNDATIFLQITSLRVKEHNPFFIYGIYEI